MGDDYDKGYRAGAMAERQRAMLVALRATNNKGTPSREGHSLAHQIGRAGNMIPKPLPEEPEEWSVFGERRLVRDMPTHMEVLESPFTRNGRRYIDRLEGRARKNDLDDPDMDKLSADRDAQIRIAYLEEQLADAPERIHELEGIVETLSLQLTGIIS